MRIKLVVLLAFLSAPVMAQNYSVQPAPQSWNLPPAPVIQQKPDPVYVGKKIKVDKWSDIKKQKQDPVFVGEIVDDAPQSGPSPVPGVQMASNSNFTPDFQNAISCNASIQIVAMAAPSWGASDGVVNSSNLWLAKAFELAEKNKVGGDKINQILKTEMEKQTNANLDNLDALTNHAYDCAANPPR